MKHNVSYPKLIVGTNESSNPLTKFEILGVKGLMSPHPPSLIPINPQPLLSFSCNPYTIGEFFATVKQLGDNSKHLLPFFSLGQLSTTKEGRFREGFTQITLQFSTIYFFPRSLFRKTPCDVLCFTWFKGRQSCKVWTTVCRDVPLQDTPRHVKREGT